MYVRLSPVALHSHTELVSEATLLKKIEAAGVPACRISNNVAQSVFGPVAIGGVKYNGLITKALVGQTFPQDPFSAKAFGKSIAKLHGVSTPLVCSINTHAQKVELSKLKFGEFEAIGNRVKAAAEQLVLQIAEMTFGQCHGDAWPGNAIYDGMRANLIDFEDQIYGPLSYDIGTYLWWTFANEVKQSELSLAFFEGYHAHRRIECSDVELRYQILMKELKNLEFLGLRVELSKDAKAEVVPRAMRTLEWVASERLF